MPHKRWLGIIKRLFQNFIKSYCKRIGIQYFTHFIDEYMHMQQRKGVRLIQTTMRVRRICNIYAPNISLTAASTAEFVQNITEWMLHEYVNQRTKRHLSDSILKLYLNILHTIFSYAKRMGRIDVNPFGMLIHHKRN